MAEKKQLAKPGPAALAVRAIADALPKSVSDAVWYGVMYEAVTLATQHLRWGRDDARHVCDSSRYSSKYGALYPSYAWACKVGNVSACKSIERDRGTKPVVLHRDRLYVGYEFDDWEGEQGVRVTSIRENETLGRYVVACSYHPIRDRETIDVCPQCGGYVYRDSRRRIKSDVDRKPRRQWKIPVTVLDDLTEERQQWVEAWRGIVELSVTRADVEGWVEGWRNNWLNPELLDEWFREKDALNEGELCRLADPLDSYDHYHRRAVRELFRRHHDVRGKPDEQRAVWNYRRVVEHLRAQPVEWKIGKARPSVVAALKRIVARISPDTRILLEEPDDE